jgi:hypothetical protein
MSGTSRKRLPIEEKEDSVCEHSREIQFNGKAHLEILPALPLLLQALPLNRLRIYLVSFCSNLHHTMPPKIEPRKKSRASLKQSAADIHNPRYMRVSRGRAFEQTPQHTRHQREIAVLQRNYNRFASMATALAGSGAGNTIHLNRQRMIHVQNRIQSLESARTDYIRQGQYVYPPRNMAHPYTWREY